MAMSEPYVWNKTIASLESRFMTKRRRNIYIVLEDLDFVWDEDDVSDFKTMWNDGTDFKTIAEYFGRSEDECGLLLMDLCRKGKVKSRPEGL